MDGSMENGDVAPVFYVGEHLPAPDQPVSMKILNESLNLGYNLITAQITNINLQSRVLAQIVKARRDGLWRVVVPSLDAEEVNVSPGDHMAQVVCHSSKWLELDSKDPLLANVSRQVLVHELAYAAFCGATIVVVQGPQSTDGNVTVYAQAISQGLGQSNFCSLLVELQLGEPDVEFKIEGVKKQRVNVLRSWDIWNTVRTVCNYNSRLGVALHIPGRLPTEYVQARWLCEPVRVLHIPSSSFILNSKGFPVLSKLHQALIHKYMKLKPFTFLSDTGHSFNVPTSPTSNGSSSEYATAFPPLGSKGPTVLAGLTKRRDDPESYLLYIRHLHKNMPPLTTVERFGAGYQDYLQAPLQPLADNLESITYEVFEKDPVKYDQYEKAIQLALEDRKHAGAQTTTIAVVGAGRGPLVTRALRAAASADVPVEVFAIEKNPNAYAYLLRQNRDIWLGAVTVIKTDMRKWFPSTPIHIMVSELLGSFADNELSPECLDGIQRVLHPEEGIMIPQTYTAHYSPIMAPKIHSDIVSRVASSQNPSDILEIPYVVMLTAIEHLAVLKDGQPDIHCAWEFRHPLPDLDYLNHIAAGVTGNGNEHNEREAKATFKIPHRGEIHGIAGYFESILYQSKRTNGIVELSTRPDTIDQKSKDMISWFPIYFPLKKSLYVPDNSEVDVSFWRLTDGRKVWYEWMAEAFSTTTATSSLTENAGLSKEDVKSSTSESTEDIGLGQRSGRLGVSDLCSSRKNGCLM